jgi:hypothetical protein
MSHVLCGVLATVAFPVLAIAQPAHAANSKKAEFTLTRSLVVGGETLKPGSYKFQCQRGEGQDFLVVTASDGREVARIPCKPEDIGRKIAFNELRSVVRPDGIAVLTGIMIKGETISHRVVTS